MRRYWLTLFVRMASHFFTVSSDGKATCVDHVIHGIIVTLIASATIAGVSR